MLGYHQIPIDKNNEENTSFIIEDGMYYYQAMPFGLKNTGATYQRLMNKIFKRQIGRSMEVYVDDMIVKSQTFEQHLADLEEVFLVLQQYQNKPESKFTWNLFVDGVSGSMGSGAGILLKGPEGLKVGYALQFDSSISNNMAEYEALLNGLQIAIEVGVTDLRINSDSQ